MHIATAGYDDPETRRKAVVTRWRKGRKEARRALDNLWDAYLLASENVAAAVDAGLDPDQAAAHVAEVTDHLASLILTYNGHVPIGEPAPHRGFQPNEYEVDGFALTVIPGDDADPFRSLLILPVEG